MGKSGICKLSTLAILSGDMSNTSLSNCGNMRPHVTANPSSNSSLITPRSLIEATDIISVTATTEMGFKGPNLNEIAKEGKK